MSTRKKIDQQIKKQIVEVNRKSTGFIVYEVELMGKSMSIVSVFQKSANMPKKELMRNLKEMGKVIDRTEDLYEQIWEGGLYPSFLFEVRMSHTTKFFLCKKI